MKTVLLMLVLILSSCNSHTLTNDEIITEVKKCTDASLEPHLYNDIMGYPKRVVCEIPEAKP
jgi:hypothetical protein